MKITVCIPTVRANTVNYAIKSVLQQTWPDWELIIISQGRNTSLQFAVRESIPQDPRIKNIHLQEQGLSLARNVGIKNASGEIITFLDDDCEAKSDWLEVIVDCFKKNPELGVVGGALIKPQPLKKGFRICPALKPTEALYDPIASNKIPPKGWDWIGANMAIKKCVFEKVGFFDEQMGAGSNSDFPIAEDTDFKLRVESQGIKMLSTPRSIVYHTYGYRYGFKAVMQNSRNYGKGNGGLAGKLTLSGDKRGKEWLNSTKKECLFGWIKQKQPYKLPANIIRYWFFSRAYKHCLKNYTIDKDTQLLLRISTYK